MTAAQQNHLTTLHTWFAAKRMHSGDKIGQDRGQLGYSGHGDIPVGYSG